MWRWTGAKYGKMDRACRKEGVRIDEQCDVKLFSPSAIDKTFIWWSVNPRLQSFLACRLEPARVRKGARGCTCRQRVSCRLSPWVLQHYRMGRIKYCFSLIRTLPPNLKICIRERPHGQLVFCLGLNGVTVLHNPWQYQAQDESLCGIREGTFPGSIVPAQVLAILETFTPPNDNTAM